MKTWEDMFVIARVQVQKRGQKRFNLWNIADDEFHLTLISSNEVVGRYKDYKYCVKQAKYRFRKAMNKVERTLLVD